MKRLLVPLLLLLAAPSWATTYYLSPTGSNSKNGLSPANAMRDPQGLEALYNFGAGDIIEIAQGTYVTVQWQITKSGSSTNPIVIHPAAGAAVTVTGSQANALINITGRFLRIEKGSGASFTVANTNTGTGARGIEFDRGNSTATVAGAEVNGLTIVGGGGNGVHIERHPNVKVVDCTIYGMIGSGVLFNVLDSGAGNGVDSPDGLVSGCYIHDTGSHGIYTECARTTIANNTIDKCDVDGTHGNNVQGMYLHKGATGVKVYGNVVSRAQTNGISIREPGLVYRNVCFSNGGSGISFFNDTGTAGVVDIYNNVTYGNTASGIGVSGSASAAGWTVKVRHNTCYEPHVGLGLENMKFATSVLIANNIFQITGTAASDKVIGGRLNSAGNYVETNNAHRISASVSNPYMWNNSSMKYSAYQSASHSGVARNTDNPLFVDAAAKNFRLLEGSTLRGAGIASYLESTDFDGVSRVAPGALGAFDFYVEPPPSYGIFDFGAPFAMSGADSDSGDDNKSSLATDRHGNWVAIWESVDTLGGAIGFDWDILVSRSSDNGASWTHPVALNSTAPFDLSADRYPRIATDGDGVWIAVWQSSGAFGGLAGADKDILFSRSFDNGASWSVPGVVNTNGFEDDSLLSDDLVPAIASGGDDNWVVVWQSTDRTLGDWLGSDLDMLVARSSDDGVSWSSPEVMSPYVSSGPGADENIEIVNNGAGTWIVVWESAEAFGGLNAGDYDILILRSTDNGVTWSPVNILNTNALTDAAASHDRNVKLACDAAGHWVAVWDSNDTLGGTIDGLRDIFVARSSNDGQTWTSPAALNANANDNRGPRLSPSIATDGWGNWVVLWESYDFTAGTTGTDRDVFASKSVNNGAAWSAPALFNTNATTDTGDDFNHALVSDGKGNWVALWHSSQSLESTGGDGDIFVATSSSVPVTVSKFVAE